MNALSMDVLGLTRVLCLSQLVWLSIYLSGLAASALGRWNLVEQQAATP